MMKKYLPVAFFVKKWDGIQNKSDVYKFLAKLLHEFNQKSPNLHSHHVTTLHGLQTHQADHLNAIERKHKIKNEFAHLLSF
jgi:hypothetical protein